jgi:transcription elongation factor Elf1
LAVYENSTQIGCLADRIKKFGASALEAYDNDKEFYVIEGFCNYYRNSKWGQPNLEKIKHESSISFDLLIDCNNIGELYRDELYNLLENVDYYNDKIDINLYHMLTQDSNKKSHTLYLYHNLTNRPKISVCLDNNLFIHEHALKSNSSYHISINKAINSNIFKQINNLVNDDIKKFIAVKVDESYMISNIAYRMQYLNEENENYLYNRQSILDKAKELNLYIEI